MAYEDLTGKTVGKFECIEQVGKRPNGVPIYYCKCKDCGWEGNVIYSTIIDSPNHPKCHHKINYDDWIGRDIGRYHVISIDHEEIIERKNDRYKRVYFNVRCNRCGMYATVSDQDLRKDMYGYDPNTITKCSHNVDESKLVGMRFGKYEITKNLGRENGRIMVEAVCTKCGFTKVYRLNDLKERANDMQETCTHKYTWYEEKEKALSGEKIKPELAGQTMGKYSVIQYLQNDPYGHKIYYVRCNKCGWEGTMVDHNILASKDTINCAHTVTSNIWSTSRLGYIYDAMVDRCYNPNNVNYPNYGAKGIKVCPEWYDPNDPNNYIGKRNFNQFAVTHGFMDSLSIDRIDNTKDYSPDNVQFVTRKFNSIFRNNVYVVHVIGNGIDIPATLNGWDKILNLPDGTINRTFSKEKYPDPSLRFYYIVNYIVSLLDPNALPNSFVYQVYNTKPIGYDFDNINDLYPIKKQ